MASDKRTRYLQKKKQKAKKNNTPPSFLDHLGILPKMSEMLIELAQPLLEFAQNAAPKDVQGAENLALGLAAIAWNMSIDPSLLLPKEFDPLENFDDLLNILIQRKKNLFPFDNRLITDFSFHTLLGERSLVVHSVFS